MRTLIALVGVLCMAVFVLVGCDEAPAPQPAQKKPEPQVEQEKPEPQPLAKWEKPHTLFSNCFQCLDGRGGKCVVSLTPLFANSEDELVRFSFGKPRVWYGEHGGYALDARIDIFVENKTNSPIYIDWWKSTYIFKDIHEPVFKLGSWTPDFVPPGATVKASVAPSDQVRWSSTYNNWVARGWGLDREIDLKGGGKIGVYLTLIFDGWESRTYTFIWWATTERALYRSQCQN